MTTILNPKVMNTDSQSPMFCSYRAAAAGCNVDRRDPLAASARMNFGRKNEIVTGRRVSEATKLTNIQPASNSPMTASKRMFEKPHTAVLVLIFTLLGAAGHYADRSGAVEHAAPHVQRMGFGLSRWHGCSCPLPGTVLGRTESFSFG